MNRRGSGRNLRFNNRHLVLQSVGHTSSTLRLNQTLRRSSRFRGSSRFRRVARPQSVSTVDSEIRRIRSQPTNITILQIPNYEMYFLDTPPTFSDLEVKVSAVENFIRRKGCISTDIIEQFINSNKEGYISILYNDISSDAEFINDWSSFSNDLCNDPDDTINLWSAIVHKMVRERIMERVGVVPKVTVGFENLTPVTPIALIKAPLLGKFITVRGTVVGSGAIKSFCCRLTFQCKMCSAKFAVNQVEGTYTLPSSCKGEGCDNKRFFNVVENDPMTISRNSRTIKLQNMEYSDLKQGTIPNLIDCVLMGKLVRKCNPGDVVTITGTVKAKKEVCQMGIRSLQSMFILVSAVTYPDDWNAFSLSFSNRDYYAIKDIHDNPNLIRLLVASVCPSIFGNEYLKLGMLLCLFGGTPADSKGIISRRSDIHMLMVGDPGMAKSQMLKAMCQVAPKSTYTCGTGATATGLTVTLARDGNAFSLEPGALVIANNGICCIDELDKMQFQHHALLEVLEQQTVSIAKAGVVRSMAAKTSIFAAANPTFGHYDPMKSIAQNIKIKDALLSRFDLTFILIDKPNQEFDARLLQHIANSRGWIRVNPPIMESQSISRKTLMERISVNQNQVIDVIPFQILRKYVAYAKRYVFPKITPGASRVLKDFYLKLRQKSIIDSLPVTTRQLESLIRMTEAMAKLHLREEATEEDAMSVIELYEFSTKAPAAITDEMMIPRVNNTQSAPTQARKLLQCLKRISNDQAKAIFSLDEIKATATGLGIDSNVLSIIDILNTNGCLLKISSYSYRLLEV